MAFAPVLADADDAILDAFHHEWDSGRRPSLRAMLKAHSESARRPSYLFMLLSIDLEHRLKAGDAVPIVEDLLRLPESEVLGHDDRIALIEQEYQGRWQRGERAVRRSEYQERFPEDAEAIEHWRPRWECPACGAMGNRLVSESDTETTCVNRRCGETFEVDPLFQPAPQLPVGVITTGLRLGEGGMGEVFEGRDPALDRSLAIKVIRPELRGNVAAERRFLREARITGRLQHPSIVPIHGLGRLSDGRLYYSMKRVDGRTLADWLHPTEGCTPADAPPDLIAVFRRVCEAMAYAHDQGVIHRDLKPSNIMVGSFGEVQVMDWGLARWLETPDDDDAQADPEHRPPGGQNEGELTAGAGIGTLLYMPPEQTPGSQLPVGKTADVFALGAILCEILTGLPPSRDADENVSADQDLNDVNAQEQFSALRNVWSARAALGDTAPGQRRLDALERDRKDAPSRELIALVRDCIKAAPADRLADAGIVVQRLRAHAELVQQQLNDAIAVEASRAELAGRLKAERWARRGLTAVVVATGLALVGGMFAYRAEHDRAEAVGKLVIADRDRSQARAEAADASRKRAEAELARAAGELQASRRQSRLLHAQNMTRALRDWTENRRDDARRALEATNPALRGWEWHFLKTLFTGGASTLVRQDLAIRGVAFHPRRRVLVYTTGLLQENAPADHSKPGLVVWDLEEKKPIRTIATSTNGLNSPAFSPDGTLIAAIEDDPKARASVVRIWDVATGEQRSVWSRSNWLSQRIAIAPEGAWLAVAGTSVNAEGMRGEIVVRPTDRTQAEIRLPLDGISQLSDLVLTSDGRTMILAASEVNSEPRVFIWERKGDTFTFQPAAELTLEGGQRGGFGRLALSRNERFVAAAGVLGDAPAEPTVIVWERSSRRVVARKRARQAIPIHALAINDDGSLVAAGFEDGSIEQWNLGRSQPPEVLARHAGSVHALAFLPGTASLASASEDGTLRLGESARDENPWALDSRLEQVRIAFDGLSKTLAVAGWRGQVGEIQFRPLDSPSMVKRTEAIGNRLLGLGNDHALRRLIVYGGQEDRYGFVEFRAWDDASKLSRSQPLPGVFGLVSDARVAGHSGELLVTAGRDAVRFWDAARSVPRFERAVDGGFYFALAASEARPERALVAGVANVRSQGTGQLTVWDAATGEVVFELKPRRTIYECPVFSPDGSVLAVAETDGNADSSVYRIRIFRTENWVEELKLPTSRVPFSGLAYSPDGQRLATSGRDGIVRLWDAEYGIELLALPGSDVDGGQLAFSTDGRWLATASQKVRLWDAGTR